MNKIVITTDSGIDPIDELNMISGQIIKNDKVTYRDKIDIMPEEILESIKDGNSFKTSSPKLGDYEDKFTEILESKKDVIHLSMSSGISEGSVNSANVVANMLNDEYENNIYVIDTLNGATGGTLINQFANDLVRENIPTQEVVKRLEKIKRQIQTSFYVPNPEGFIRSGRNKSEMCAKDKAILMGVKTALMAGIKFRVDFNENGNLYTRSIMKCKASAGMLRMVKEIINEQTKTKYSSDYVVIGNILEDKVDMEELEDYLKSLNYFDKIINQNINGVVAAYGSKDLCGISLVKKR